MAHILVSETERRDFVVYLTALHEFYEQTLQLAQPKNASATDSNNKTSLRRTLLQLCRVYHQKLQPFPTRPIKDGVDELMPLTWRRMISGSAEAATAARVAAFNERARLSVGNQFSMPLGALEGEPAELVINFPPHLFERLCQVSAGGHGWAFAVDMDVANAFNTTTRSLHTVVRTTENGFKSTLGVYQVHRWFEADMYGPEFFQLPEEDRDTLISRLTHETPGTVAFNMKARALLLSQNTISCLFLQHLPIDGRSHPIPSEGSSSMRSLGTSSQRGADAFGHSGPSSTHTSPPPQSQSQPSRFPLLKIPQGTDTLAYYGPPNTADNTPPRLRAVQVDAPYVPPPRVTVPLLNVIPPTPKKGGMLSPPPLVDSYPSSRNRRHPYFDPQNRGTLTATSAHNRSDGVIYSSSRNSISARADTGFSNPPQILPRAPGPNQPQLFLNATSLSHRSQRQAGPLVYWDQNNASMSANMSGRLPVNGGGHGHYGQLDQNFYGPRHA
ncbi:hypothetical protein B0H11DRAFT_2004659 [Mycena galericulata]|nr:hypothetical protein B0H11DRAFT_2004659 [Mycena galericulata]